MVVWTPLVTSKVFLVNAEDLFGVCAFDDPNNRTLTGRYEFNEDMTIEMCLSICRSDQGIDLI